MVCIIYIVIPKEEAASVLQENQAWLACRPHGSLCWLKSHMCLNVWNGSILPSCLFVSIFPINSLVSFWGKEIMETKKTDTHIYTLSQKCSAPGPTGVRFF